MRASAAPEPTRPHDGRPYPSTLDPPLPAWVALLVVGLGLVARLVWHAFYGPVVESDAITYIRMAAGFRAHDLSGYDGAAPPVYALFLLLGAMRPAVVVWLQSACGLAIAWWMAQAAWRWTGSARVALIAGLMPALRIDALACDTHALHLELDTAAVVGLWAAWRTRSRA